MNLRPPEDETLINIFRKRRKVTLKALGVALGVTTQAAGRYCLPARHPDHCRPNRHAADRLSAWSDGKINVANYADPWTPEAEAALGGFNPPASVPEDVQ